MRRLDDIVQAIAAVVVHANNGTVPQGLAPFALTSLRFVTELVARLEDGRFHDPGFVRLLALDANERYVAAVYDPSKRPGPWRIAMDVAARDDDRVLRNLLLGINAHVSYDLVATLSKYLSKPVRASEREDFFTLNDIIRTAVDGVQSLLEKRGRLLLADRIAGRIDEWATWATFKWTRANAFDDAVRVMNGAIDYKTIERKATAAAQVISLLPA